MTVLFAIDFFVFKWGLKGHLRCVDYQAVPLSLDVILRWLFSDVEAIKLQLPGNFFFSFKYHQRDLGEKSHWVLKDGFVVKAPVLRNLSQITFPSIMAVTSFTGLECTVVATDSKLFSFLGHIDLPFQKLT